MAALTLDRLVVAADGAQTLEIRCDPGWDGRVVVGAVGFPWGDRRLAAVLPTDDPTSYRLLVVNAGGGEIRHEELFASEPAGFSIHGHPSGDGLIVEGGVGQEGTGLWTVRETPTGIAMEALPQWDRVFAGFSPGGVEILTTPHLGRDLVVHRWPDWGPVATIPATGVFALDGNEPVDRFDFFAGYLSVDSILAKSAEYGRLVLLDRRTGFPSHEVRVPGLDPDNDGATALHSFTTLATGHLVTWSWHGIEAAMHVWMPPRELAGGERPRA